jgi:tetratricopeptide (TPR) repeat protein
MKQDVRNTNPAFSKIVCLLLAVTAVTVVCSSAFADKDHYYQAVDALRNARLAEETAQLSAYASDIANYYQLALRNYETALEQAERSSEESEELSEKEKRNRRKIISEALKKIKICKIKYDNATFRKYFDNAVKNFNAAKKEEENAKTYLLPRNKADSYQAAIKNYELALKQARRSSEESEQLSEREKYERENIINESRERIAVCRKRYSEAANDSVIEELRQNAHKYIVAGFNYATANDKAAARRSWNEAIRLYEEALSYVDDAAVEELIKSKIQAVGQYLEHVQ